MKRKIKLSILQLLLIIFFATNTTNSLIYCASETIKISSFKEVDFSNFKTDDLVVFDCDKVLIAPTDMEINLIKSIQELYLKNHPKYSKITLETLFKLDAIRIFSIKMPLIEPEIIDRVNELKNRGVNVIVCTACTTGSYNGIFIQDWRYKMLEKLGFVGSFCDHEFSISHCQGEPWFFKGIIFTDLSAKGPLLKAFIEKMKLSVNRIVFFDDRPDFLKSVEDECKENKIEFLGYQYEGFQRFVQRKLFNKELCLFKVEHLIDHNVWLCDEEAIELMNKTTKDITAQEKEPSGESQCQSL